MHLASRTSLALIVCFTAAASAQETEARRPEGGLPPLRVPIHTAPADPAGGEYGLWAAGPDFKAGFHDGFVFVPLLGRDAPENLPFAWETRSVAQGEFELLEGAPTTHHEAWRFERRWPAVVEAYDVREDGVEQSFVVHTLPRDGEDLVVTGRVTTPLSTPEAVRPPMHGGIRFHDAAGRAVIEYGAAVAFDAAGRVTDVRTALRGDTLQLVVDGRWLADALLPVTIDPLVRTVIVDSKSGAVEFTDVARDDESDQLFYVYSFAASAGDMDQVAWIANDDLNQFTLVFSDLSTTWTAEAGRVTFVGGADRWVMAMHRFFPTSNLLRVRAYLHDKGELTLNSGRTLFLSPPSNEHDATPAVGGDPGQGTQALIAFRKDFGAAGNSEFSKVHAVVVDCAALRFGTPFGVAGNGSTLDAEAPSVNRFHSGAGDAPWIVAWQENSNGANAAWKVLARQVRRDGTVTTHTELGQPGVRHNVHPQIEGAFGRYLVTWIEQPNNRKTNSRFGFRIRTQRFDWADGASTADKGPIRTVAEHPTLQNLTFDHGHALAFDTDTDSHWMVAWRERNRGLFAARLGFDALAAESVDVRLDASNEDSGHAGVCFDDDRERFLVAFATAAATSRARIAEIGPLPAAVRVFGSRCPARLQADNNGDPLPLAGSEFFTVRIAGGRPAAPSFLVAAFAEAPSPIPLPASQGCVLSLDPAAVLTVVGSGSTNASGTLVFPLPLPSPFDGELFVQGVQIAGGEITASDALQLSVR